MIASDGLFPVKRIHGYALKRVDITQVGLSLPAALPQPWSA